MLFYAFCEFADGSSKYLRLKTATLKDAHKKAIQDHYASQVLWIISSLDPFCRVLKLEYTPLNSNFCSINEVSLQSELTTLNNKEVTAFSERTQDFSIFSKTTKL